MVTLREIGRFITHDGGDIKTFPTLNEEPVRTRGNNGDILAEVTPTRVFFGIRFRGRTRLEADISGQRLSR